MNLVFKPRVNRAKKIGRECAREALERLDESFSRSWTPEEEDWAKFEDLMQPYIGKERAAFMDEYMDELESSDLFEG